MHVDRGYTSRALAVLDKITRFDGNPVGADDRDHFAGELAALLEEEKSLVEPVIDAEQQDVQEELKTEEEGGSGEEVKSKGDGEAVLEDNDYSTVFNIHIKNITNPPPPRLPPAPPAAVEAESSQEDSRKGRRGRKKAKPQNQVDQYLQKTCPRRIIRI